MGVALSGEDRVELSQRPHLTSPGSGEGLALSASKTKGLTYADLNRAMISARAGLVRVAAAPNSSGASNSAAG